MVKTKKELLNILKENFIQRSYRDIFISEIDKNGYILSFVVSFGKNNLVYFYDKNLGYISFFYKSQKI